MYFALFWIITNILMLFMAAFVGFPSSTYYYVLRLLTCFSSLAGAFIAYEISKNTPLLCVYLLLAILFNPVLIVSLGRELWSVVDILSGILLIHTLYCVAKDSKVSLKSFKIWAIVLGMSALAYFFIINGRSTCFAFISLGYRVAALLMTFGTFAISTQLFNRKPVAGKEPSPIILILLLAVTFAACAYASWTAFFNTISKI